MAKTQQKLPKEISDYINSGKAISEMDEIAEKAEIYNVDSLYSVLFELIRKQIPAGEFINEISREIGVDREMSLSIAHEIKENVLDDIKYDLKNWGVDLEKIETPNPTPLEELSISEMLKSLGIEEVEETYEKETPTSPKITKGGDSNKSKKKQIPISSSPKSELETTEEDTKEKISEEVKPKPSLKDTSGEPSESKPFMIHQENKFDQKEEEESKGKGKRKRKKSFSFSKDGFFDSNKSRKDKESPKAQINTPEDSKKKKKGGIFGFGGKKEEKERVVHYSDNRTDLSDDGSNKFINLSNLEPTSPNNKKRKRETSPNNTNNKATNKNQKKNPNVNKQKKRNKEKAEESNSSKNSSFLGNIDEDNVNKKNYKKEDGKNKGDGPHVDGNTVDLSQN